MAAARRPALLLAGLLLATAAGAADITRLEVDHDGDSFTLHTEVKLHTDPEATWYVLTDYDHFGRITGAIRKSERLEQRPDGKVAVHTLTRGCFGPFCRDVGQIQLFHREGDRLIAETLPRYSDLEQGRSEWILKPTPHGTRLVWKMQLEPKFWVPPLIGTWLMERALRSQARYSAANIETLARRWRARHGPPPPIPHAPTPVQ